MKLETMPLCHSKRWPAGKTDGIAGGKNQWTSTDDVDLVNRALKAGKTIVMHFLGHYWFFNADGTAPWQRGADLETWAISANERYKNANPKYDIEGYGWSILVPAEFV